MVWFAIAVAVAALAFLLPLWSGGGAKLASLLWSTCEASLCTGLCLGLPVLFREASAAPAGSSRSYPRTPTPPTSSRWPDTRDSASAARAELPLLEKFAVVSATSVPLSFALGAALRTAPGLRHIL
jgi:hypothetical protein